jgi:hypothetical protein
MLVFHGQELANLQPIAPLIQLFIASCDEPSPIRVA